MAELATAAIVILLAYANGANDNFKGVATLFGSSVSHYRGALIWATATTLLGSLMALFLATALLDTFSGKGLVPDAIATQDRFALAVGLAAGITVLLASRLGFPISTTHALVGGLIGTGLTAAGGVDFQRAGGAIFLPLLASPIMAVAGAFSLYPLAHRLRQRLGIERSTCVCLGTRVVETVPAEGDTAAAMARIQATPRVAIGEEPHCRTGYSGSVVGLGAGRLIAGLHYLSAGAVSFARGLNDTPKIAALLLVGQTAAPSSSIALTGVAIAAGGWISARRVAETMAHRVTDMNPGQGLTANLATAALVIGASRLGLPVSTTHVSCGSLFGIGAITGHARWGTISAILAAWLITLPVAGIAGALAYVLLGPWLG